MTTQPLKSSLLDPTPAPVLGVAGAIAATPSFSKIDIATHPRMSNERLWQTINIKNSSPPSTPITAISVNGFQSIVTLPTYGVLDMVLSTSLEVEGYKMRFQAVKLDGSEVRFQVAYTYGAGALYGNGSNSITPPYCVISEFTVSNHLDEHVIYVDLPTLKVPTRIWGFPDSRPINPFPYANVALTRITNFYTTPFQPDNFDMNVFIEPYFKTSGSTVPQGRTLVTFVPTGFNIIASPVAVASMALWTKNKAVPI